MNEKLKVVLNWCKEHRVLSGILGLIIIAILFSACSNVFNNSSTDNEIEDTVNTENIDSGELSEDIKGEAIDYINQMEKIKEATPDDITADNASEALERIQYKYDNLGITFYMSETNNTSEEELVEMADKSDDLQLDAFEDLEKADDTGDQKYADSAKENLDKSEQITQAIKNIVTQ